LASTFFIRTIIGRKPTGPTANNSKVLSFRPGEVENFADALILGKRQLLVRAGAIAGRRFG
jgi:hypothetical protein